MKLLALSTSTPRGGAALLDAGAGPGAAALLAAASYVDLQGHAERIFDAAREVLEAAGVARRELFAVACDVGPGSFTGVRVAVASAKGIALALALPAVGVSSLEAMAAAAFAEGAAVAGDLVVPLLDAKKGEVFLAAFDAPGAPPIAPPRHLDRGAALPEAESLAAGRRLVVVGEVASEIAPLRPRLARGAALDLPDAIWVGRLALGRLEGAQAGAGDLRACDPALLEPLYVRAPDAKPTELGYAPPR